MTRRAAVFVLASLASTALAAEKGSEQVAPYYGSFSHAIPIEVPGFRGLEPGIALTYSSEARNGFVGVGWNLAGFSTIERVNEGRGSTAFAATDRYLLDGQEMFACPPGNVSASCASGGTHAFKIENYLKVAFASNVWTVWQRNGTRSIYTPILPASQGTLRWGRTSTIDTKGNTVTYGWTCLDGDGDCYPATISYNNYLITFHRELRPEQDIQSFAAYDGANRTKYRLRSITQNLFGNNIRAYSLTYTTSPLTGRSLLTSVQQRGRDAAYNPDGTITGGSSLPPMNFTYRDDAIGRSFVSQAAAPPTPPATTEPVRWASRVRTYAWGSGNSLHKESGGYDWNAGAISTRSIVSGNGYMEFTAQLQDKEVMAGLSNGNSGESYTDIDFAIYEQNGTMKVYQNNNFLAGPFPIASGDKLRVEIQGNTVYYKKNGVVMHWTTPTITYPLLVDTSIRVVGNDIVDVVISGTLQDSSHWCSTGTLLTADANSDGRTDQICQLNIPSIPPTGRVDVALGTATGFQAPTMWMSGHAFNELHLGDVNGDNRIDLIDYVSWYGQFLVSLNTGSGFANPPVLWGTTSCHTSGGAATVAGTGDYNGDGITDVSCKTYPSNNVFVGLSNGASAFTFSLFGTNSCETVDRVGTLDFNGDGKDDWYCIGTTNHTMWVSPSTGSSFEPWAPSLNGTFCNEPDYVLGDLNGDGRTDAYCRYNGKVALSSGRHFVVEPVADGAWCPDPGVVFASEIDGDTPSELICDSPGAGATDIQVKQWNGSALTAAETWKASWCDGKVMAGDFNGDAKTDLLCSTLAAPVAAAGTFGVTADLAITLTNGLGGTTQVGYGVSTSFPNTNTAKHVATSINALDGRGGSSTTTYQYDGGQFNPRERRFMGFSTALQSLPCLPGESYPNCPRIWRAFRQDLASAGQVSQMNVYTDGGYPSRVRLNAFTTSEVAGTLRSLVTAETAMTFTDDAIGCPGGWPCAEGKRVRTTHIYDTYGNRSQTTHLGDQDASGDETTEQWIYYPNPSDYIVSAPGRHRTFAGTTTGGALLTDVAYRYDNAGSETVPPTDGYPTTISSWLVEEGRWIPRSRGYDTWGNLTSETDGSGRTTSRTYDSGYHIFTVSESNNAGETATATWDPVCGSPATKTDPNLQTTTFQPADAFCRPTRFDSPLGGFEIRSYLSFGNPALQRVRVETPSPSPADGTGNHFSEEFFDGRGRPWRRASKGPGPGQVILTDSGFNARGSIASSSAPYHGGGAAPYAATEPVYLSTFVHDALDRVTATIHPDANQVTKTYGLFSETTTDEHLHDTTIRFDVFGRKVRSERTLSETVSATEYGYDLLGRMTSMRDAINNYWYWTFDSLGRNVAKDDPDAGEWTYVFDDAGRLETQTDARNQRTDFLYDLAGRPLSKSTYNEFGIPEETVNTAYGEARSGYFNVGRATTIAGPGATTLTIDYDAAGRVAKNVRTIDGTTYNSTRVYDAGGRPKILRYSLGTTPGPDTVSYTYDAAGRVKAVTNYISWITYDAAGRPLIQMNTNQTVTERAYDAERGFLTAILTTIPAGSETPPIQSLIYTPDAAGMLSSVSSPDDRETWAYEYDEGHRLTSATSPRVAQSFQHDAIDRMTYNSRFGGYYYPGSLGATVRPHAPTSIDVLGSYSYDDNGNLVSGAGRAISWNVSNKPTSITSGGTTTTFAYGGSGERLKKVHAGVTSVYPFGDGFEITTGVQGSVQTRYITVPGVGIVAKLVGPEATATPYWLHTDRLGSIQAVTNTSGTEVFHRTYEPFGDKTFESGSHIESRGYIEQRQDESGLIYLHARYYDPAIGIFVSPDPIGPAGGMNEYAYALNDPINGRDRSGYLKEPDNYGKAHARTGTAPCSSCMFAAGGGVGSPEQAAMIQEFWNSLAAGGDGGAYVYTGANGNPRFTMDPTNASDSQDGIFRDIHTGVVIQVRTEIRGPQVADCYSCQIESNDPYANALGLPGIARAFVWVAMDSPMAFGEKIFVVTTVNAVAYGGGLAIDLTVTAGLRMVEDRTGTTQMSPEIREHGVRGVIQNGFDQLYRDFVFSGQTGDAVEEGIYGLLW